MRGRSYRKMKNAASAHAMTLPTYSRIPPLRWKNSFDFTEVESSFTRTLPERDDSKLLEALSKKIAMLTPTLGEQVLIQDLVSRVQNVFDSLSIASNSKNFQIEEVRQVGSYKKGTMRAGQHVADIVVVLKNIPTKEIILDLMTKVEELLNINNGDTINHVSLHLTESGFSICNCDTTVKALIATRIRNIRKLSIDGHVDVKTIFKHLSSVRHVRWAEENAYQSSFKTLTRLILDVKARFSGFAALNPWMIDLLCYKALIRNSISPLLPINVAFRRVFELLAGGIFLPGTAGIVDPCEPSYIRVNGLLMFEQQDAICCTAQTIIRVLSYTDGYMTVLGFDDKTDIVNTITVWDGIVVSPSMPVYEKEVAAEIEPMQDIETTVEVNMK